MDKPTRCIDPVMRYCQECEWGWIYYPEWVETTEDLSGCTIESGCTLGYDQGRPEDEPTEEELREFETWCKSCYEDQTNKKFGYCPLCDEEIEVYSEKSFGHCPICGHHLVLRKEKWL